MFNIFYDFWVNSDLFTPLFLSTMDVAQYYLDFWTLFNATTTSAIVHHRYIQVHKTNVAFFLRTMIPLAIGRKFGMMPNP